MDAIDLAHAITLEIQRQSGPDIRRVSSHGLVEGQCPGCGADPFHVIGQIVAPVKPNTRRSGAYCTACGDAVGYVTEPMGDDSRRERGETIFGAEEDIAVRTRARVY